MNTITVGTQKEYPVYIGKGLLCQLPELLKATVATKHAALICDSNVWPLYGKSTARSLETAGYRVETFVFPAGEASKNGTTYLQLLEFLASRQLTRTDCLLALGGGVTGDLAGFVAATYLRGIAYIQLPTTLLAAVDSSVGGKTAIDLQAGKNLAGAFYQPRAVICDTCTLDTLPPEILQDGCAEVIKYDVLYDPALLGHMVERKLDFDREWVILRCVQHKNNAVSMDEFDTGMRQMLNLGHTFGHGVEGCSGYTVSHGKAVAIGMAMIARSCAATGKSSKDTCERILEALQALALPTVSPFTAEQLLPYVLSDKKRSEDTLHLILPEAIGHCSIVPTPVEAVRSFMEAGM